MLLIMILLTCLQNFEAKDILEKGIYAVSESNHAFVNPEDVASFGKGETAKKYLRTDPDVERVRRGHLNDLENIVPFVGIGLLYALSGPELSTALLHFRIFTGARILHTFAYLIPLPQPGRGLSWAVAYTVTISMAYKVLKTALYL
ncbi:microsomal glutathione s-transferase 1 [Limosa lapponica baueri]|uniref:Microsomal glutathione S-transferase 1 n=1 Tax=Limosa lapponica baueri TaxID=1758121 RepID=A0A2I0TE37_LIMLA|nr:microsomal glutathione s-transferase 1 [Limosa lapponica baueri]